MNCSSLNRPVFLVALRKCWFRMIDYEAQKSDVADRECARRSAETVWSSWVCFLYGSEAKIGRESFYVYPHRCNGDWGTTHRNQKRHCPHKLCAVTQLLAIFCAGWLRRQNLDLRNLNSVLLCVILYSASFSSAWTEVSSLVQREFWSAAIRQKRDFSLLPNHNTYPASNPDVRLSLYNSWNMNTVTIQGILT